MTIDNIFDEWDN